MYWGIHQVPASGQELAALDAAAFVDAFWIPGNAIGYRAAPDDVAVAFDYGVSFAAFQGFFGKRVAWIPP